MKTQNKRFGSLTAILSLLTTLAMTACLDYDSPADEFEQNEISTSDVIYQGAADSIIYDIEITKDGFYEALDVLYDPIYQALTGIYAMRGGKEGDMPGGHAYQRMFSLGPDNYAQFATVPHSDFMYGSLLSTYDVSDEFNSGPKDCYLMVKNAIVPVLQYPQIDSIPELKAIYLLLYDYSSQEVADLYGPLPYNDYKSNRTSSPFIYDDLRTIYVNIEANIDTIVRCLRYFDNRPQWYKDEVVSLIYGSIPLNYDMFYGIEDMDTWIQFANSFKLRLAMHLTKVDPTLAQQWAEEAVSDGVIESWEREVGLFTSSMGISHPVVTIAGWGDTRLSASFESILMSLNHPYASYVFDYNSDAISNVGGLSTSSAPDVTPANTRLIGMREGTTPGIGQSVGSNQYIGYSMINTTAWNRYCPPLYLMKVSEVDFLRAEGALRGWDMGGTAQYFYEHGIDYAYFEDRTFGNTSYATNYLNALDDYKAQTEATPYTYIDPSGNTPDMASVTTIGVAWDDSDDNETKLEKIITQKYIAAYPYPYEPWVDLRRTGYPKVFPVLNPEDGDGSLSDGEIIRRMPWAETDASTIQDIEDTGLDALGGDDLQATRLWWDTDDGNF